MGCFKNPSTHNLSYLSLGNGTTQQPEAPERYAPEIERAMDGVKFIADHLKDEDKERQVKCSVPASTWMLTYYSLIM